jgi:beta-carotene 15,15'-dioxygenase
MNVHSAFAENKSISLKLYLLGFGVLLVIFHQFVYTIPAAVQWLLFAGTMLLTGIPHGAIDHLVDEQSRLHHHKSFRMIDFLVRYLSRMALYALLWWIFPVLAFAVFFGIAAYHFGETDLMILPKNKKTESWLFFTYGWLLLNILILTHQTEVVPIFHSFPHFLDTATQALISLVGQYSVLYFSICALCFLACMVCYSYQSGAGFLPVFFILIQGSILLLICSQLPFLLAFSLYFGLWHSLLSLQSIREYLMKNEQLLTWRILVKKAVLFSSIAISGIVILIIIGNQYSHTADLLLWLFIGIAVLTAPHMEIMSSMFTDIRTQIPASSLASPESELK